MARSVDYLNNALYKVFLYDVLSEDEDAEHDWQFFKEFLGEILEEICPSLTILTGKYVRWEGREVQIVAENRLCEIGISEYCGIISVSIRVIQDDYSWKYHSLAVRWIKQMWPYIQDRLVKAYDKSVVQKIATASNGESFYQPIKQ